MCKPYGCFSDVPLAAEPLLSNPFSSFLLCPALLSPVTALQCLLTSLFQLSFLKMFYLHSFASFPFFPLPLPLICTAGVISSSTEQGQPSQIPCRACPSHSLSAPTFSFLWLCVVICSSQEPCCFLPSVLFALTLVVLLSDPHQVLSNPLFLQLLMSCRPMAQICRSSPHVNTSMTRCCLESVAASYKPALGVVFTRIK